MSDAGAALVEPLATATHAVRVAGDELQGRSVVILGGGTIGLLLLIAAPAAGAQALVISPT